MSGFQKNVTGQKWRVFAFNRTTNVPLTGDAAQISAKIAKDNGAPATTDDLIPTEVEDGYYLFDLLQAETNADVLDLFPESSTGDIQVIGVPGRVFTVPPNFATMGIENDGDLTKCNLVATTTANSDMRGTDSAALASLVTSARMTELDAGTAGKMANQVDEIRTDTGEIGTAGAGLTDLGGMSNSMKAEVNVEAKDVLFTDTDAEPGQELPAATNTLAVKIGYLFKAWRNRSNQTATEYNLFADNATTVDQKATVSDDTTTAEKGEIASGP